MRITCAVGAILAAFVLVACAPTSSSSPAPEGAEPCAFNTPFSDVRVYPTFVSSEKTVGSNRFLVGLLNDNDAPVGSPRVKMRISFFHLDGCSAKPASQANMKWMWITRPYLGLYRGRATFDRPGRWGASVHVRGHGLDATVKASFDVTRDSATPSIGERVPASDTPTTDTAPLRAISTDKHPMPRLYRTSIADAIKAHEPFVVVFATPKFCTSRGCAPMLDNVKKVARARPDITFIHVEPYQLPADPAHLKGVPAAIDWGLPSEPWVFVVGAKGRLLAKYEGALTPGELAAELRRLP